ncbi:MAG: hypothetical protein ACQEQV_06035 [Fibrobacterota bacterium]
MATLEFNEKVCAVCGTRSQYAEMANVPIDVPVGIDGHPGETDALSVSLNFCPGCGYAAENIAVVLPEVKQIVESPEYQDLIASESFSKSVLKFVAASLIYYRIEDYSGAISMLIRAVWMAENLGLEQEDITTLRLKAIDLMLQCRSLGDSFEMTVWQEAQTIAEHMRREKLFDDAREICEAALARGTLDENLRAMLEYEHELCRRGDSSFKVIDDFFRFKRSRS